MKKKKYDFLYDKYLIRVLLAIERETLVTRISKDTGITLTSVQKKIDVLEQKGLIKRKWHGRKRLIDYTQKGRNIVNKIHQINEITGG